MDETSFKKTNMLSFNIIGYAFITLFALICVLPFYITVVGSFTAERYLIFGISLWPQEVSVEAYRAILTDFAAIARSYGITILTVVIGTPLSLFVTCMAAYALRHRDFKARNIISFYFFFTTLFSGGLVPYYILITKLNLRDNFWVLIIPSLVSVFNIIIVRTYFSTNISDALQEAATIDGAGNLRIFFTIYLPLAIPVLATISLFTGIGFWNQWYSARLFINDRNLFPLQYLLYRIFINAEFAELIAEKTGRIAGALPRQGFRLAMTVITTGPIILAYPFVQKYFVSGMTIGAVKG